MRRDYAISFAAEGLAVALSLLAYRVAATGWTAEAFAEYALSRKILSVVLVVVLVGMDIAIVRFVAVEGEGRASASSRYVTSALAVVVTSSLAVLALLGALQAPLGALVYGDGTRGALLVPIALAAAGAALYGVAYGNERARLRMGHAAFLLVAVTGLAPLLAVYLAAGSVSFALVLMGIGSGLAAAVLLAGNVRPARALPVRSLVGYGAPRSLGLVLQLGLLAAPGVVIAHRFGIVEAGNVAFALLGLGLLSTLFTPIGVVLMPRSAAMSREGATGALRSHVRQLLLVILPLIALAVGAIEVLADPLVGWFLGPDHASAAVAVRAIVWAAIPWAVFVTLRGLLDAQDVRPLNARNILVACVVYGAGLGLATATGADEAGYHFAFLLAVVALAALTLFESARVLSRPLSAQPVVETTLQP